MKYVNLKQALNEYLKIADFEDEISRTKLMGFANDAVDKIISDNVYDLRVIVLPISNYGCELPNGFVRVEQALYKLTPNCTQRREVIEWTQKIFGTDCHYKITKECPKCKSIDPCECGMAPVVIIPNHLWHMNYGEQVYGAMSFREGYTSADRPVKKPQLEFQILHRTTNNFHTIKEDLNDNCNYPRPGCRHEYSIRDSRLITSFKDGEVLLSYKSKFLDDDGYLMVPDNVYAFEAITSYIAERNAFSNYHKYKTQSDRAFWFDMVQLSSKTIQVAKSKLNIPPQDEFEAWMKNHWRKFVRNTSSEYNFDGYKPDEYKPYSL